MGRIVDILSAIITPTDTDSNTNAGSPVVSRMSGYNGSTWTRLSVTAAGLLNLAAQAVNAATAPTSALAMGARASDGKLYALFGNILGHLMVLPAKGTGGQSSVFEATHVISTVACWPARIGTINTSASQRFMMLFNATSLPGNGAVPLAVIGVGSTGSSGKAYTLPVDRFTVGCVATMSSTSTTLTVSVTADALYEWDLYPSPN